MMVNVHEAKTHLSKLLERVAAGEEVVIGKAGKPVARLVRYEQARPRRVPGRLKGKIWIAPDFDETPEWLIDTFEGRDTHMPPETSREPAD
jgi:prevent-host-death family protein